MRSSGTRATAFTYDVADHLTSMDGPTEPGIHLTIDALGRSRTRRSPAARRRGSTYLGASDAILRIGGTNHSGLAV